MSSRYLTPYERRSQLEVAISDHVIKGFEEVDRGMTWAEMYKPKRFSPQGCLLGLGIFYLIYYALYEKEDAVYLEVTPQGELVTKNLSVAQVVAKRSGRSASR
jgi:hypothetical protein